MTADDESSKQLLSRVVRDGLATHGHARALVGACAFALAVRHALRVSGTLGYGDLIRAVIDDRSWFGSELVEALVDNDWRDNRAEVVGSDSLADEWQRTVTEMQKLLTIASQALDGGAMTSDEKTLDALGCFGKTRGAGTITAAAAIYLASRSASRPSSGLLRAAFTNESDTDTLASATASILGALHGSEWLGPLATQVQDRGYIERIAESLRRYDPHRVDQSDQTIKSLSERALREWRDAAFSDNGVGALPDGRAIAARSVVTLATLRTQRVERLSITTLDGQDLLIDRAVKGTTQQPSVPGSAAEDESRVQKHPPSAKLPAGPAALAVVLSVASVSRSAEFYGGLLGLPCRKDEEGRLVVADGRLVFAPGRDRAGRSSHVVITAVVADINEVLARARATSSDNTLHLSGSELHLVDPDGYDVRIATA